MDNKTTKVVINVFAGLLGFGLGLIAVSFFLGMVEASIPMMGINASLKIFDADWNTMDSNPVFIIVSFIVILSGIIVMAVDVGIKQKAKKQVKGLNYIALALTIIGFILVIVSTVVTKNAVKDEMIEMLMGVLGDLEGYEGMTKAQLELVINMLVSFKLGVGAVMAIVGGVFALIASILLVLPQFNPIQLSQASEQTAPATAPAAEQPAAAPATEQPTTQSPVDPFDNNDTVK